MSRRLESSIGVLQVINACRIHVGQGMEPWGTPGLTGYSCVNVPSRTTRCGLLLRNKKKQTYKPNLSLSFRKKSAWQILLKALNTTPYSSSSPRFIKNPSNSIDTTIKRPTVERRGLKPYWKIRKKTILFEVINKHIIYNFFLKFYKQQREE